MAPVTMRLPLLLALSTAALAAQPVTVYLELGQKAEAVEDWSGSLSVSNGALIGLESRHFSAADELSGG